MTTATLEQSVGVWAAGRTESVYRGDAVNSVSNSERECFRQSPEKYYGVYIDKTIEPDKTTALDIGGGLHEQVLLPNGDSKIAEIPDDCLKSNGARNSAGAAYKQFAEENAGRYLLKRSEVELVNALRDRIIEHPIAGSLLAYGDPEVPVKVECPDTGLLIRCRYDWLTEASDGSALNVDIKTYGGDVGDRRKLCGHILSFGYCRQLAFYRRIHLLAFGRPCRSVLAFVEKKPPNRVQVVELDDAWLNVADAENAATLEAMAEARKTGCFATPGVNDVLLLSRPRWADYSNEYAIDAE